MNVEIAYGIFVLLSLLLFRLLTPQRAVLVVFLGGWLLLPVGQYAQTVADPGFPYWITGLALPSDMVLNKAWVVPLSALLGVLLFDSAALLRLRFHWSDIIVVAWCLWPLLRSVAGGPVAYPDAAVGALLLTGSWGLTWLLGRLYFNAPSGHVELLRALAIAGIACLPISVIEGTVGPRFYSWLYQPHPFRFDGVERYLGYRPIGFFEHGSQFGIWICLCGVAALWVARSVRREDRWRAPWAAVAALAAVLAFAAQSIGGLFLAFSAVALISLNAVLRLRYLAAAALGVLLLGGGFYLSGAAPVTRLAKQTAIGQTTIAAFRSVGRSSLPWRIAQDQTLLPAATTRPIVGTGAWDWWRGQKARPWGMPLLIIGHLGAAGLFLAYASLVATAFACIWRAAPGTAWQPRGASLVLACIVAMAAVDSLLNSFLFYPALLLSGALARQKV